MSSLLRVVGWIAVVLMLVSGAAVSAQSCTGTPGTYATEAGNYQIDVTFPNGTLVVTEPNKTSTYTAEESCVFGFTNPTNNIRYLMKVVDGGKALMAYKPGMSAESGTRLNLIRAAAPVAQSTATCSAKELMVQNPGASFDGVVRLWGATPVPDADVTGTYTNDDGISSTLLADGSGTWGVYGQSYPIHWWIQANCDGSLVDEKAGAGHRYMLVVQYGTPYQGHDWDRFGLAVQDAPGGVMAVLDRIKKK